MGDIRADLDAVKPELHAETLDAAYAETVRTSPPRAVYDDIPPVKEGWEIGEDPDRPAFSVKAQLAWCLRKGAEHDAEIEALDHVAGKEVDAVMASVAPELDAIKDWLADQTGGEEREKRWFHERLVTWAIADRASHLGESQLTKLPSGSVSTTHRKSQIVVEDADVFLEWYLRTVSVAGLNEHPRGDAVVSWVPKVSIRELRKDKAFSTDDVAVVDDEGEIVSREPAVFWQQGEDEPVLVPGLAVSEEEIIAKVSWG